MEIYNGGVKRIGLSEQFCCGASINQSINQSEFYNVAKIAIG